MAYRTNEQTVKRSAGLVIFRKIGTEIQYLMMQASYGKRYWGPPKGGIREGESESDAAIRETSEETGLIAGEHLTVLEDFRYEQKYNVKGRPKVVVFFLAELNKEFDDSNDPVQMSREHQNYKWLSIDGAIRIEDYETMRTMMRTCHQNLTSRPGTKGHIADVESKGLEEAVRMKSGFVNKVTYHQSLASSWMQKKTHQAK